jgi:hypothetical protein
VLNELDEKFLRITEMLMAQPGLLKLLYQGPSGTGSETPAASYILDFCRHVFHMHQRGTLSDKDWAGWLRWMRTIFQSGTIATVWKSHRVEIWFEPAFREFVEHELLEPSTVPN